jgi:hypothetical protein
MIIASASRLTLVKAAGSVMKADAREKVVQHLFKAIDRVRDDVEKVEFWADIVTGFAQPVPEYDPNEMRVWLPPEQATNLKRSNH